MRIATLSFEGFNELDSFIASAMLIRVKKPELKALVRIIANVRRYYVCHARSKRRDLETACDHTSGPLAGALPGKDCFSPAIGSAA